MKLIHLLNFIPFMILLIVYIFMFFHLSYHEKLNLIDNGAIYKYIRVVGFLMNIQVIIYNLVSMISLVKYQKELKSVYSLSIQSMLKWLKFALYGYIAACIISELLFFCNNLLPISFEANQSITYLAFMIFFNVLFYKVILNPSILSRSAIGSLKSVSNKEFTGTNECLLHIKEYLENFKPYLNPNLTLKELSALTGIQKNIISHLLNDRLNQTFYAFINQYRIEEAKKLLTTVQLEKTTILGVAFDSGFNSKTVFYDTFKKYVGMSPLRYRQNCA